MTNLSLPPITVLATAAADLVLQAADAENTARVNSLNKAALHLHSGIEVTLTCGGILIPSGTRGGIIHRVDNVRGCSCEAGRKGNVCWHASLVEIIERAQMHTMPALKPMGERVAAARKALALVNELF